MKSVDDHGTFDETIAGTSPEVQEISKTLRELIIDVYPDVVEVAWANQGIIGYGVGPKKMSEHFCYIGLYKAHVNLGFYYGARLQDPDGLLEGTGKNLRHVKVRTVDGASRPALRSMVEAALAERIMALGKGK